MSKTVMLSEAAYNTLKAAKKEGESFSETVLRLASGKGNMNRILEAMKTGEFHSQELARNVEQTSKDMRRNFKLRDVEL